MFPTVTQTARERGRRRRLVREPEQLRGGVTPHPQGRAEPDPCDVESRMTVNAILEATGGYDTALVAALAAAALPVVVANPRQVRDFAKATGQLAKTDHVDAHLLALFAERCAPRPVRCRMPSSSNSTPS